MSLLDGQEIKEVEPKMSEETRLEFAAIAWTFPETEHIEMDSILAEAFAKVIDIIMNGGFGTVDSYVEYKSAMDYEQEKTS